MSDDQLELVEPTESLCEAYAAMVREFGEAGEPFHQVHAAKLSDFAAFVAELHAQARGEGLPDGYVPQSTFWLVRGGHTVLGTGRLRHRLAPRLLDYGGHIGYDVRPSQRGRGYATLILRSMLAKARELGIARALVTCDDDNAASARVIEKCGGLLVDVRPLAGHEKPTRRYWIRVPT